MLEIVDKIEKFHFKTIKFPSRAIFLKILKIPFNRNIFKPKKVHIFIIIELLIALEVNTLF